VCNLANEICKTVHVSKSQQPCINLERNSLNQANLKDFFKKQKILHD